MSRSVMPVGLFPALLKHWRRQRGVSQLDLAVDAGVSARHISFVETGRSRPSPEMVLRLAEALGVPLRHTDEMLRAAGHGHADLRFLVTVTSFAAPQNVVAAELRIETWFPADEPTAAACRMLDESG